MPKHPVKMNGGSLTRQILFPIDKSTITNTALRSVTESRPAGKMPALPAPLSSNVFVGEAIRWPGECCYRGESANLSAYGGDRV